MSPMPILKKASGGARSRENKPDREEALEQTPADNS